MKNRLVDTEPYCVEQYGGLTVRDLPVVADRLAGVDRTVLEEHR